MNHFYGWNTILEIEKETKKEVEWIVIEDQMVREVRFYKRENMPYGGGTLKSDIQDSKSAEGSEVIRAEDLGSSSGEDVSEGERGNCGCT